VEYKNLEELKALDEKKRYLIGYFDTKECKEYETFRRVASNLKDDCTFLGGFGEVNTILCFNIVLQKLRRIEKNKLNNRRIVEYIQGCFNSYAI
jgi:hypothetical protein